MRVRNAARNLTTSLGTSVVAMVAGFVATPFLLRWLGEERFGATRALLDWLGHLALLDFGLSMALRPMLTRAAGRENLEEERQIIGTGVRAYTFVVLIMTLAYALIVVFVDRLVPVRAGLRSDLQTACLLASLVVLLVPLTPGRVLAEVRQRGFAVSIVMLVQMLVTICASLVAARYGLGISGQVAAFVAGQALVPAFFTRETLARHPSLVGLILSGNLRPDLRRELFTLNGPYLVINICARVSLLSDGIIVAALLGPALVVPLVMTQRLASMAGAQLSAIGNAVWPGLAELHARGEHDTFSRRLVEITQLTALLGSAAVAPIAAYNENFVALWVGANHYGGDRMTAVVAVNTFVQAIFSVWSWCFSSTGKVRPLVPMYLISATVNLAASVALARSLGPIGPLIGTLLGYTSTVVWLLPWQLRRTFGVPLIPLFGALARPAALGAVVAGGLWWMNQGRSQLGWTRLAVEMTLAGCAYLALAYLLVLGSGERAAWRDRARAALRRGA